MRFHGQFGNILKVRETLCTICIHTYTYGRHTLKKSFFCGQSLGTPPPHTLVVQNDFLTLGNGLKWIKI